MQKQAGIELVAPAPMIKVPAQEIAPPIILYKKSEGNGPLTSFEYQILSDQVWHPGDDKRNFDTQRHFSGRVLVIVPKDSTIKRNGALVKRDYYRMGHQCVEEIFKELVKRGVEVHDESERSVFAKNIPTWCKSAQVSVQKANISGNDCETVFANLINKSQPSFILYLNPTKGAEHTSQFAAFKRVTDIKFGIRSLCVANDVAEAQTKFYSMPQISP